MKNHLASKLLIISVLLLSISCNNANNKKEFDILYNFSEEKIVNIDMDLDNVVNRGIVIPSVNQGDGKIEFRFEANEGEYYKIYYQNESYKFPENDVLSDENFYGSWEDATIGFKRVEKTGEVVDSFRIVGNPRDEKKYYGADLSKNIFSKDKLDKVIKGIKKSQEWYSSIVKKAKENGFSIEKQLDLDARWIINNNGNKGDINNRWKRNPRVGNYSFILVVCSEKSLNTIPEYIQYINKTIDGEHFVNPYSFFALNSNNDIKVYEGNRILKTRAVVKPQNGVFFDELKVKDNQYTIDSFSDNCGVSDYLYKNALFEQFFCHISKQYSLRNIPLVKDVVSDDDYYTRNDYEASKSRYDSADLHYDYPVVTNCPCSTVKIDEESITLINPGNEDMNRLRKESTGIRTRVGFTYGKYRGKIKFPVMLNKECIWNGLTYAFWLIYQDDNEWNNRRKSTGYIDKGDESENPVRLTDYYYSEIDIEIVKASRYWPKRYYNDKRSEDATLNNDVMFCCTNWDLACREPEKFKSGITKISYDKDYEAMRWYDNYKALTIKTPISNDVFKEEYYYYEIEWKPTEIIWRIGPSPDNMQVVGYMNDQYTCIPNNQMLCVITQEYHYSEWWPPIVYEQGLIPYNKTDIEGKVYEIVIE